MVTILVVAYNFESRFCFLRTSGVTMTSSCLRSLMFCSGILLLATGSLFAQEVETRQVNRYTIEQFLKTTNYRGASFSPDKSQVLVSNDSTGVFNAYSIDVDSHEQKQLTDSETDSVFTISYFPNDERFLYTSDQGGNELNHLYVCATDGSAQDITPGNSLKAQFYGWSSDDQYFYVGTNERDEKYFDVYAYDQATLERELIFQNENGYDFGDISPDGNLIALSKNANRDDSDSYLFNRTTGEVELLTPHEGEINYSPASFSPDGKSLLLLTDAGRDFRYLIRQNLETGERETVAEFEWDVASAGYSKRGKYLVLGINEDARNVLQVFDVEKDQPVELPVIDGASISSFGISDDETQVAMYVSSDRIPSDVFVFDLTAEESATPARLTTSLNADIEPNDLVSGDVVRFKSFDGLEVPGILYRPHQAGPDKQVPALVWVHGGPGGQSRVGYSGLIQYMVNNGYAVFAINNRGSSGYGKKFEQLDNRNHGKKDLMDCVTSKQMLIETGYVAPDRIGIIGGSYGGFMTLAALAFQPEEFRVGVDIFGVANWHRTVQSIPPWWEAQRAALEKELGDFSDEEYFRSMSPLFHADKITRPLMVLQGANDPRVLKVESDEMVAAVRKNGVTCEYIVFDDEGHGFQKKENQARGYRSILDFCDKHLKGSQN